MYNEHLLIKEFDKMAQILGEIPVLERVEDTPATIADIASEEMDVLRTHAGVLREDPAMRTLTELVRSNPVMWDQVSQFISRRSDFREDGGYELRSRVFAPLLTGITMAAPELVDTAVQLSTVAKSEKIRSVLDSDKQQGRDTYIPVLVVGTGPQSQIFNAELQQELPDFSVPALTVEKEQHMGGTFRTGEGMNFLLNSRTRPQTDERPRPGTKANINDLRPGILTPGDTTNQAYIDTQDLGRTVSTNHTFSSTVCLGMEVESYAPNPAQESGQKGALSVVLVDKTNGERTLVRTDNLAILNGLGEDSVKDFGKDDEETRQLVAEEQEKLARGERSRFMSFEQFSRLMNDPEVPFPLQGVKRVAVIGARYSGNVAVGTLLGYEPRGDKSTTQLDFTEEIVWFGQQARSTEDFVRTNRLRYAQLGLDFSRPGRFSRIRPNFDRAEGIFVDYNDGEKLGIRTSGFNGDELGFDLVIYAGGYERDNEDSVKEMAASSLSLSDIEDILDSKKPRTLTAGDIIVYPEGFNIESLQVIGTTEDGEFQVKFTTRDGQYGYDTLGKTKAALKPYLDPSIFIEKGEDTGVRFGGVIEGREFLELDPSKQQASLQVGSLIYSPSDSLFRIDAVSGKGKNKKYTVTSNLYFGGADGFTTGTREEYTFRGMVALLNNTSISGRDSVLIKAPYVLTPDQISSSGELEKTDGEKLGKDEIIRGIENGELLEPGTVLIDSNALRNSRGSSFLPLVIIIGKSTSTFDEDLLDCVYFNREGITGRTRDPISRWLTLFRDENSLDTVIRPSSNRILRTNGLQIPSRFTEVESALETDGRVKPVKVIAKKLGELPVYLGGPAAEIEVDPTLVDRIPDIPENTVGVFASAENVRQLAQQIASDVRANGKRNRFNSDDADDIELRKQDFREFPINEIDDDDSFEDEQRKFEISRSERRFDPALPRSLREDAVRLTLGFLARQARMFSTEIDEPQTIHVEISKDGETLIASAPEGHVEAIGDDVEDEDKFFDYLFGYPLIADYMESQLGSHDSVKVDLVFDQRGLNVRSTTITPVKKPRARVLPPKRALLG